MESIKKIQYESREKAEREAYIEKMKEEQRIKDLKAKSGHYVPSFDYDEEEYERQLEEEREREYEREFEEEEIERMEALEAERIEREEEEELARIEYEEYQQEIDDDVWDDMIYYD